MADSSLQNLIDPVQSGRWAIGVSGGADSVALLLLLKDRPDLSLHVAHLDHETREGQSGEDARFVSGLAGSWNLSITIGLRSEVESSMANFSKNTSSRYRAARFEFFQQLVKTEKLRGVLLAHHADDQAETVAMRILRGASLAALGGIQSDSCVGKLRVIRPLLRVRATQLRQFLQEKNQFWREDASNASDRYLRNRVRRWLARQPALFDQLLKVGTCSRSLRQWLEVTAPVLTDEFETTELTALSPPIAKQSVERWLVSRGVPAGQINPAVCERLIAMASDAATSPRQDFPGPIHIKRKRGRIGVR